MATYDLIGVPVPVNHPAFANDEKLIAKVWQLDGLIELRNDFDELTEALSVLRSMLGRNDSAWLMDNYGTGGMWLPDMVLSYIVILYAKAFTESTGRTRLNDKTREIFGDELYRHDFLMDLRHNFYAHHGIEANRHQVFVLRNTPNTGQVKLHPEGQKTRIVMSQSIGLEDAEFCINVVHQFLKDRIAGLCRHIESSLNDEQRDVINKESRESLLEDNWHLSESNRVDMLKRRNT